MLPKWQTAIVKQIEQATPNTRKYWLELVETTIFNFLPGQFTTLDLPISEQRNKRWRSYSIASMPQENNIIELIIAKQKNGVGSVYIFDEIKEGDTLTIRGPQGHFVLPEMLNKDLFFICTGTGIAPFRSMLLYIEKHKTPHKKIYLIFGTRQQEDLLYKDEMLELQNRIEDFHYYPTISREKWDGYMGYVHPIYEALCINKQEAIFMLCGWRAMIDEAKERILLAGYEKKDIHMELYG